MKGDSAFELAGTSNRVSAWVPFDKCRVPTFRRCFLQRVGYDAAVSIDFGSVLVVR